MAEGAEDRVPPRRSWRAAVAVYAERPVAAMLFLGFSAGLPFLLVFSTLSLWLREAGVDVAAIGFVSWIGITYSVKVLWAPVVDRLSLPLLTRWLGRRRGWMLLAMAGIATGLVGMAFGDPAVGVGRIVGFALLVAFSSATQDVALDAFRIEMAPADRQGALAAAYQLGYRVALLVAGAGALYLAEALGWRGAYLAMAALTLVGMVTVLLVREPPRRAGAIPEAEEPRVIAFLARHPDMPPRRRAAIAFLLGAVVCPFTDFLDRHRGIAIALLLLVALYRISDITMGVMANPFYIDLGFTKAEIANVIKLFGFWMTILGAFLGGLLVARFGLMRPLLLGAVLAAATNLLFALLAWTGRDLGLLVVVISADNIGAGLAGAVFIAFLSSLTSSAYTATQYALFSSLMTLPGKFIGGFSGLVVAEAGYTAFFLYTALVGLPVILLILFLARPLAARAQAG